MTTGSLYERTAFDSFLQSAGSPLHSSLCTLHAQRSHPSPLKTLAVLITSPLLHGAPLSTHCLPLPYSLYATSNLDVDVYPALLSLKSFLQTLSLPLFKIILHILFYVAVDAARPFWNVPSTNCCSCFNISLKKALSVRRKTVFLCFNFLGTPVISKPMQQRVSCVHHLHLSCSENART